MKTIKPIIITNEETGEEYILEFSRESVVFAENHGFVRDDIVEKMMIRIPQLFYFAFKMHHPKVTQAQTDKILFEDLGGISEELSERLVDLFNAPYETLINENGKPKNSKVTVKF